MSEIFDEVDEDVRRDQLKKLWDQYSIYIVAGALLIIAAVGGWRGYQYLEAKKAAEAGAAFDKAVELSEQASMPRRKRPLPIWRRRRHPATACWRGCGLRPRSPAAIRKPPCKLYDDIADRSQRRYGRTGTRRIRAAGLLLDTASYPICCSA